MFGNLNFVIVCFWPYLISMKKKEVARAWVNIGCLWVNEFYLLLCFRLMVLNYIPTMKPTSQVTARRDKNDSDKLKLIKISEAIWLWRALNLTKPLTHIWADYLLGKPNFDNTNTWGRLYQKRFISVQAREKEITYFADHKTGLILLKEDIIVSTEWKNFLKDC